MNLLIAGSRSIKDVDVGKVVGKYLPVSDVSGVIAGGAVGVDTLAAQWASSIGIEPTIVRPDWLDFETPPVVKKYNRYGSPYNAAAGMIRNSKMLEMADVVLVIWDGESKGSMDTIRKSKAAGKRCFVHHNYCEACNSDDELIFVFGSNLAGRHGAGAARHAVERHGAVTGVGHGITGSSYAIPTKNGALRPLSLGNISVYVKRFLKYAADNEDLNFIITPVGTGLAGYKISDIGPMFTELPANCTLSNTWKKQQL